MGMGGLKLLIIATPVPWCWLGMPARWLQHADADPNPMNPAP